MEFLNTYTPEITVKIATLPKKKWVGQVERMEKKIRNSYKFSGRSEGSTLETQVSMKV